MTEPVYVPWTKLIRALNDQRLLVNDDRFLSTDVRLLVVEE